MVYVAHQHSLFVGAPFFLFFKMLVSVCTSFDKKIGLTFAVRSRKFDSSPMTVRIKSNEIMFHYVRTVIGSIKISKDCTQTLKDNMSCRKRCTLAKLVNEYPIESYSGLAIVSLH